jgi:hypothetical protein
MASLQVLADEQELAATLRPLRPSGAFRTRHRPLASARQVANKQHWLSGLVLVGHVEQTSGHPATGRRPFFEPALDDWLHLPAWRVGRDVGALAAGFQVDDTFFPSSDHAIG